MPEWDRPIAAVGLVVALCLSGCADFEAALNPKKATEAAIPAASAKAPEKPSGPVALAPSLTGTPVPPAKPPVPAATASPAAAASPAAVPAPISPPVIVPAPVAAVRPAGPLVAQPAVAPTPVVPPTVASPVATPAPVAAVGPAGPVVTQPAAAAAPPPGTAPCPAGTLGMWSEPDVVGTPVFICRRLDRIR